MSENRVENFIYKEGEDRPWYFSSYAIYALVKGAAVAIPHSEQVVDKTVDVLSKITVFIKEKTGAKVVVVTHENSHELVTKLDGFLSDQLIRLDDGLDYLRQKLATALRALINVVQENKELASKKLSEATAAASGAMTVATTAAKSRMEQSLELLKSFLTTVQARYPDTYEKVSSVTSNTYQTVQDKARNLVDNAKAATTSLADRVVHQADERITIASAYVLKTAQPYVTTAVHTATPYVATAVEVTQPYVVQAKPYLEPIITRADEMRHKLEDHKVYGPYVARVYEGANRTFEGVRVYCMAREDSAEEGAEEVQGEEVLDAPSVEAEPTTATTGNGIAIPVDQDTIAAKVQAYEGKKVKDAEKQKGGGNKGKGGKGTGGKHSDAAPAKAIPVVEDEQAEAPNRYPDQLSGDGGVGEDPMEVSPEHPYRAAVTAGGKDHVPLPPVVN